MDARRPWLIAIPIALVLFAALGYFSLRAIRGDLPSEPEQAAYVTSLRATVVPVIEELQVEYFMDAPGCANLTYRRGDFIDGDPEDCGGSTGHAIQFDDVARADHARVVEALDRSRTPIERLGGRFTDGALGWAFFSSTRGAPFAASWELLHDPDDVQPEQATGQVTYTAVPGQAGWVFACCSD